LLGCLTIPVAGVSQVAFGTMQMRVHPCARAVVDVLRDAVSLVPVFIRRMSHRPENGRHRRWFGISKRGCEFLDRHDNSVAFNSQERAVVAPHGLVKRIVHPV